MSNTTIADRQERKARRSIGFAFGAVLIGVSFAIAGIWTFDGVFPLRWQALFIVGMILLIEGWACWSLARLVPTDLYQMVQAMSTVQVRRLIGDLEDEVASRERSGEAGAEMTGRKA